ncbi:MAG: glutamate mutase L [Chloroflexota bacterium]
MSGLSAILAVDVGSTTTKALLFTDDGTGFRRAADGNVPTTVEAPLEDVMIGVRAALARIEAQTGRRLLADGELLRPARDGAGVDLFVATSSAGGGLQMMVSGVVRELTGESAERVALGAGAIVLDVQAVDDGRQVVERIQRIRGLRPDMILISGGTDGGNFSHVLEMAEIVRDAKPAPRFGAQFQLPVVFAGNADAAEQVSSTLGNIADVRVCPNIRPVLEQEVVEPAREQIHRLFLEHVMQHAPGYDNLVAWAKGRILPTPAAVGEILSLASLRQGANIIAVDVGGATTDVFSVSEGAFNRTVSANLGMSYSLANVAAQAGVANVMRWLAIDVSETDFRNWLANKMIRPTTLSQTIADLMLEQATAREALRLALDHHRQLVVGLKGVQQQRSMDEVIDQRPTGETKIDLLRTDMLIGSGGVLSHAPRRAQAMQMMIDGLQPEGVTALYVDSVFMLPHLGILSRSAPEIALDIFQRECLVPLGTCVAPVGPVVPGRPLATVRLRSDGEPQQFDITGGEVRVVPLPAGSSAVAEILPAFGVDCGGGPGRAVRRKLTGGAGGLVLDGRGRRPLNLPLAADLRRAQNRRFCEQLAAYPDSAWADTAARRG